MNDPTLPREVPVDENRLIAERRSKLDELRVNGGIAFPNDFRPDAFAGDLHAEYGAIEQWDAAKLEALGRVVRVDPKRNLAIVSVGLGQWEVPLEEVFPLGED